MSADGPRDRRSGLTPETHARIRWQLVLLPSYLWLVYGWHNLLVALPRIVPVRDFAHFYVLGVIARERYVQALYDMDLMATIVPRVVPGGPSAVFPPAYGPQVALFFSPLAALPYTTALYLWFVLTLLTYGACAYAIWRVCPALHARPWSTTLLLVAAPALYFALGWSQISAIGLVCVTSAYLALHANRPFLAGVAIGTLAYKPQLGLAAAFVFIAAREWRIVSGAAAAAAGQLAIGAIFWGPSVLMRNAEALKWYVGALQTVPVEPNKYHMHSWRSFFELLGLPYDTATLLYVSLSIVTLVIALGCWRSRGPLALRYSAVLLATILVDPHLYAYDLILLTPALLLLWNWIECSPEQELGELLRTLPIPAMRRLPFKQSFQWLLYICYFSPLAFVVAIVARVQVSVLAHALLVTMIAALLRGPRTLHR